MATNPIQAGQTTFLMRGGIYEMPLMHLREKGLLPEEGTYVHQEYPKALNLSLGVHDVPRSTEDCKGRTLSWIEGREIIVPMVVQSEDEEDAVRAAFDRAEELGIAVQPEWTPTLLLHALKVAEMPKQRRNGPRPTPEQIVAERIAKLKAELAALDPADDEPEPASVSVAVHEAASAPRSRRNALAMADLPVVAPEPAA